MVDQFSSSKWNTPLGLGVFQQRRQKLPDEEEKWGLEAAKPHPNTTNLSS
jgi:hypothetical protein